MVTTQPLVQYKYAIYAQRIVEALGHRIAIQRKFIAPTEMHNTFLATMLGGQWLDQNHPGEGPNLFLTRQPVAYAAA